MVEYKKKFVIFAFLLSVVILLNPIQYADADDVSVDEDCTADGWTAIITDDAGNSLSNVRVSTIQKMSSNNIEESFYTDENGFVVIPPNSDTGFIKISKGGYNDKKFAISCNHNLDALSTPKSFDVNKAVTYSKYTDPNFGFTMEYPMDWDADDELIIENGIFYPIVFYDEIDAYFTFVEVRYAEQEIWVPLNNDAEELEEMSKSLAITCAQNTFDLYGFECSNFELGYSRVIEIDGQKQFEFKYSWVITLEDNSHG